MHKELNTPGHDVSADYSFGYSHTTPRAILEGRWQACLYSIGAHVMDCNPGALRAQTEAAVIQTTVQAEQREDLQSKTTH